MFESLDDKLKAINENASDISWESSCCHTPMTVVRDGADVHYGQCNKCKKPCDIRYKPFCMCTCGPLNQEKIEEIDKLWREEGWLEVFRMFYSDEEKGSGAWLVGPRVIENFIRGLLKK